ncbi:MAG: dTDP-4-dehydrorhamnose 3,5-epimerase [Bacteroidetes bacterium]|nr:dTDP-4-dehydrorhamnose 3,5-epimerase [Bacteroidota bacterium]
MNFREREIQGIYEVDLDLHEDERGTFVKTYHKEEFEAQGLTADFRESFYSMSKKGVIRGMHFQLPPHDHSKVVYAVFGKITDVLVDLRKKSATYGRCISVDLSDKSPKAIYIPRGIGHGFTAISDQAILVYNTTQEHHPDSDTGIRWNSFDFHWPVDEPIISKRDTSFTTLEDFDSPF